MPKIDDIPLEKYVALVFRITKYVAEQNRKFPDSLPTIRFLARKYHLSHRDMLTLVEDADMLDYNIGIQISGYGSTTYGRVGDYTVEYMDILTEE